MELRVRNFAKIAEADIIIDGITIIAGNNNTGKSTIGKILDVVFNTTNNIGAKMNKARTDSLSDMLEKELEQILAKGSSYSSIEYKESLIIRKFADQLLSEREDLQSISEKVEYNFGEE